MSQQRLPRENAYFCPTCRMPTVTVDVDIGVTPMFLACRASPECAGMASSSFYPRIPRPAHAPPPAWEWYKPTEKQAKRMEKSAPGTLEHVRRGGLLIRPRTSAEPIYHNMPERNRG